MNCLGLLLDRLLSAATLRDPKQAFLYPHPALSIITLVIWFQVQPLQSTIL